MDRSTDTLSNTYYLLTLKVPPPPMCVNRAAVLAPGVEKYCAMYLKTELMYLIPPCIQSEATAF